MLYIMGKLKLTTIVASFIIMTATSYTVSAEDVSSNDTYEKVVISIKTDPTKDPEPACVAIQIGMNLLMNEFPDPVIPDAVIEVTPADAVTLFLTTGGVELVNPHNSIHNRTNPKYVCTIPDPDGNGISTAPLQGLLAKFESMNGASVVLCPLCVMSRGITEPITGDMGSSDGIHNLFLYADKVIDF